MSKLFNAFDEVSSKAWKQKIQFDLKGADYNDSLIWNSPEGIDVKPFYHADTSLSPPRISEDKAEEFKIGQTISVENTAYANNEAINALSQGVDGIHFIIRDQNMVLTDLIKGIDLTSTPLHFSFQFLSTKVFKALKQLSKGSQIYVHTDIIGNLAKTGNWFSNLREDHKRLEQIVQNGDSLNSILSIDMALYQNAGATMIQQLAYGLAHANEYLNHFNQAIKHPITFNVSVGSNYFFEISKIRALRWLWKTLAAEYNLDIYCNIVVSPSHRNKTIYDYNTNLLRSTTECMSAILGGADMVCNLPYDAVYKMSNDFSSRIAKNQLLILKNESYFNAVSNPSDGTYYIENLTAELAQKALQLFKDIEANGGFLKQLKDGIIQRKIKESATKEQMRFDQGIDVLLGTNVHPNPDDKMKNNLEVYPFLKINKRKTLIEPIIQKRLSEKNEQTRLKNEE
jgi:methylmalonyl-CoA mutase